MSYWPFCSAQTEVCTYVPAIIIGVMLIIFSPIVYEVIKFIIRQNSLPMGSTPEQVQEESRVASSPRVITVGEKWLIDNNLPNDSYGSLIYEYCGLGTNLVQVRIINVNLDENEISVSIKFPKTANVRIGVLNLSRTDFTIDEELGPDVVMGDIYLSTYVEDISPKYDKLTETPLQGIDWDNVTHNMTVALKLNQLTYDKYFPSNR
jgi:hypothetical protein